MSDTIGNLHNYGVQHNLNSKGTGEERGQRHKIQTQYTPKGKWRSKGYDMQDGMQSSELTGQRKSMTKVMLRLHTDNAVRNARDTRCKS